MYKGQCQCGNIHFSLSLPQPIESYSARQCDCQFCLHNQIIYLSDPEGELVLPKNAISNFRQQGDERAKFIICENCQQVIAAICEFDQLVKGAINVNLVNATVDPQKITTVSPRLLSAEEKISRWQKLWLTVILK